ncbi:MAG: amidohydrolase family protein [Candidatus Latescibacterota bacterium]
MGYIDAHVHVWTQDAEKYPLAGNYSVEDVRPPLFLPEDILSHARPCGVERVVLVQMSYYGFDNRYMLDVMRDYDGVFSGIAVVDVEAERPDDEMRRLSKEGVRGFRVQPRGDMGRWLDGTGYERFAATPVIVDHLCRIGAGQPIVDKDIDALCALAQYPQVMVKVSAFYALGAKKPPYTDLDPLIRRVYEAFGAERLMWASDCPYQVQDEHSYAASVDLVEKRLDFLSEQEREQLLGGTAAAFFFNR